MSDIAELLISTWHRVYGDGVGWSSFKAAVDDQRFDEALSMLAPGLMVERQRLRPPPPGNVWKAVIPGSGATPRSSA